jgi:hypothetical protein
MSNYSWKVTVAMPAGEEMDLPHNLQELGECTIDQVLLWLFHIILVVGFLYFFQVCGALVLVF